MTMTTMMMMRRRRRRRKRLYLYRHHFIDSMLGCSRRHNAVTGHFSFEQEATTFVPYFCCPPHFVFLYLTLYELYMSWYIMYYITIWTGSHISAAHHNRYTYIYQAYLTRLSCYWLHWTKALLSKPLSTQISDNTQRNRVRYSCQQIHRLQKRISHRLGCTQIAKARISPSCSSSPLSPWAERVPFFASQCFKDNSKLQR